MNLCLICGKESEAEVCDICVKRFCKEEHKGYCFDCNTKSCIIESNDFICPICRREVPEDKFEKHHLVPKSKGGEDTVKICVCCGDYFHKVLTLNELRDKYNTLEKLRSHPLIVTWAEWINKKPNDFNICMKTKKRR